MDDPTLDRGEHDRALAGLARLNRLSRAAALVWKPILQYAGEVAPQPIRVLDVASGGGDVVVSLSRRARRAGIRLECVGCDISPTAIDYSRRLARRAGVAARFHLCDALTAPLPVQAHVVMSSLFLHHLDPPEVVAVLKKMAHAATARVVVCDLLRSRWALWLTHLVTRSCTDSRVVHADGPLSVRAAFTIPEISELAHEAGLVDATVQARWPFRFVLEWKKEWQLG